MARSLDRDLLREARERYAAGIEADKLNRIRDQEDRKFYTGGDNQWMVDGKNVAAARRKESRPADSYNRLPQFVKQVSGELRQNKPAIKVLPVDGQTDPEMADVYTAIIRHVEGASGAHRIYAKTGEQAAIGGQGWWRIKADYCGDDSFDQELLIERIPNPLAVVCDTAAKEPTRIDKNWAFVGEMVPRADFEKSYPDISPTDFDNTQEMGDWVQGDFVRVAEYWRRRETGKKTLYALKAPDGRQIVADEDEAKKTLEAAGLPTDDLKASAAALGLEIVSQREVCQYVIESIMLCGAGELTEWQSWPGKYIPLVRVVGEEVEAGDTVFRHGMIHHAKAPQVGYNYARNAMMERHGQSVKSPWLVTAKMIQNFKAMWESANTKIWSALIYDPDPQAPQGPQRTAPPQLDAAAYQESMIASEDMKATTGIYDAALGAKSNETSGVAIARRDEQGNTATYVYIDNLEDGIETTGRMLIDLIPNYYSGERVIRILGEDDEVEKFVAINKIMPDGKSWNDVTRGKYDLVVSTGPAYATRRQEASENLMKLSQNPAVAQLGMDIVVRALDIPMGDKLADRLKNALPPGIDEDVDKEKQEKAQQDGGQGGTPQPPPSPEMLAMQAEQQRADQQAQAQQEGDQARFQLQSSVEQAKLQLAEREMEGRLQIERDRVAGELAIKREALHLNAAVTREANETKAEAAKEAQPAE